VLPSFPDTLLEEDDVRIAGKTSASSNVLKEDAGRAGRRVGQLGAGRYQWSAFKVLDQPLVRFLNMAGNHCGHDPRSRRRVLRNHASNLVKSLLTL
jgi:hypothetical protein